MIAALDYVYNKFLANGFGSTGSITWTKLGNILFRVDKKVPNGNYKAKAIEVYTAKVTDSATVLDGLLLKNTLFKNGF